MVHVEVIQMLLFVGKVALVPNISDDVLRAIAGEIICDWPAFGENVNLLATSNYLTNR
jgi:hypothetical protein